MTHPGNRPVALSLRIYRALARAFPYEFKNAYGDELVQVTENAIEPIWRRHGVLGLVWLLADIALRDRISVTGFACSPRRRDSAQSP